ncbi:DUF3857 domain-containing protein [Chitinophaga barathri]|uniref:DUF3857 domain-containing protein n=1 Tax=Chitinophaga barathri TaxID=1647451 RepID=A0A3N4MAR0_9BACT|nr:DUF3857 domain-containing protein [Chitinophaga barathri]RPD40465.1 DUF3857 domain-containing protein [Chitinophaga barathri]
MKTYIAILICLLLLITGMMAQERKVEPWDAKAEVKYKKRLAEVKEEIWSWKQAGFKNRTVPAEYAKESAVVLAKHIELTTPDKDRELHRSIRVLVAINDKAALEEYSEFSFKQYESLSSWYALEPFDKMTKVTYMGARIFKKDGGTREIYSDEAVVTEVNRRSHKTRKLAIPDLQVGDMIEYFVREERFINHANAYTEELFVLGDEEPVMEYSVHVSAWEEVFALEYRCMNGAPNFKQKIADHMMQLDMLVKNVPPQPVKLWMNPFRQIPMVRLHLRVGARREKLGRRKEGTIYSNPNALKTRDEAVAELVAMRNATSSGTLPFLGEVWDNVKQFKKTNKNASDEELTHYIYYLIRYMGLYRVNPQDEIVVDQRRNWAGLSERNFLRYVNYMLVKNDIDADFVLATPRYGPSQNEVFETDDFRVMLKTVGKKPVYMSAEGIFSNTEYIPAEFEGQKAPLVTGGPRDESIKGNVEIPYSEAKQNRQVENLLISFGQDDLQQLKIDRTSSATGHFKQPLQQKLLLYEDYYDAERQALGIKQSFMDEFADSKRNRSLADEYRNAFEKARKDVKESFLDEVKTQFDNQPESLDKFSVLKMGLRHNEPEISYNMAFTMNGYIKKAGSNYIIDAGRLIGPQMSIKPSQRERKADVYMPFARSFEYNLEFRIPAGYTLEGADKLARSIDNECGSFVVTTKQAEGKLTVSVKKIYKNAFAPAAKWPQLLEMVDAAEAFQQQKILLRKA